MNRDDVTTKLAVTEASLKRWQTRLKRAAAKVGDLDRQRRRYQLMLQGGGLPPGARVIPAGPEIINSKSKIEFDIPDGPLSPDVIANVAAGMAAEGQARLDKARPVPAFLDRSDPHIAARMTAARKAAEAEERKKMPLTGKAAVAKIRETKAKK